jgi:uncharacterized protein (DUF342 family)/predicted Ser/Thr protein kinase
MTQTQTILGKYALIKEIGRGGMGVVYQAHDQIGQRDVAIKELRLENLNANDAEEMIARFQREARTADLLKHPAIVTVYDFGTEDQRHYLVMELLEGKTLKELLSEGYAFQEIELLDILIQICDAMGFAHQQGVVHRDIKPDNILITANNKVKIMDFGIARMNTTEHFTLQTQAGTMLGTLSYMSPEQLQDSAMVDHRADIFSLGVMIYEIYTGRLPFEGESMGQTIMNILSQPLEPPNTHNPSLRPELNTIILRMLHKRRGERYQQMSDVAAELQQLRNLIEQADQMGLADLPRSNVLLKRPTGIMRNRLTAETRIGGSYKDITNKTNPAMGRLDDILEEEGLSETDQTLGIKPHIFNDRPHGITLEVSADWLKAWLNVDPLYALETVTTDILTSFLERSGIQYGLHTEVIEKAVRQGFLERECVALGDPVEDGLDGWLEYLLDEVGSGPVENEDGSVDFRQLNILTSVPAKTPLLLRHPPQEGKPGRDLTGKTIQPRPCMDRRLLEGEGTCIHPEDPNLLIAAVSGHPIKGTQSVSVKNLIELDEVGVKSGNIHFDGSVIISGNVHSGYQVEAGGDIIVQGSVEDAILKAGGNLIIQGSVFGNQKTHLSAKRNIHAHFIQQAHVECQGSLHVREALFHCQVRTVGPIRVGTDQGKGQINGGQVSSAHLIKTRILGSPSSTTTTLFLGVDPIIEMRLGDLDEELKVNKRKLEENIKSLIYIRTQARDQVERQQELESERTRLMIEGNTLTDEVQFLKEQVKLSSQAQRCRILALEQIYAGVRFNFSGAMKTLEDDQKGPLQARCLQKNSRDREVTIEYCADKNLED